MRFSFFFKILLCIALPFAEMGCTNNRDEKQRETASEGYGKIDKPLGQERAVPGHYAPPTGNIVIGNLIVDGKWYVLSATEIQAIEKLQTGMRIENPDRIKLPPLNNKIIPWEVDGIELKSAGMFKIDDEANFLESTNTGHVYEIIDENQKLLLQTLANVRDGARQPIAVEKTEIAVDNKGVRLNQNDRPIKNDSLPLIHRLPSKCIVGANFIYDNDKWFTLKASDIQAFKKMLTTSKDYVEPEGCCLTCAFPTKQIVLWGVVQNEVVALDIVAVYSLDAFLLSFARWKAYAPNDPESAMQLSKEIANIHNGKEKPIASTGY